MTRRAIPSGTSITMPDWNEEGLVLSVRPHGENSALVTLLTAGQGRHAGLVRGASSAKMRGVLQPGNLVRAAWRARLSEQLGQFTIELDQPIPALLLDDPLRLAGVAAACAVLDGSLPEREPQPALFEATGALLQLMCLEDPGQSLDRGLCQVGARASAGDRFPARPRKLRRDGRNRASRLCQSEIRSCRRRRGRRRLYRQDAVASAVSWRRRLQPA